MSKFGNVKTDGYHSKKEAKRAQELRAMLAAGEISDLREQVKFELIPTQRDTEDKLLERSCNYVADFVYKDKWGLEVVEDCKGFRTETYNLKRKLMLHKLGIRILET